MQHLIPKTQEHTSPLPYMLTQFGGASSMPAARGSTSLPSLPSRPVFSSPISPRQATSELDPSHSSVLASHHLQQHGGVLSPRPGSKQICALVSQPPTSKQSSLASPRPTPGPAEQGTQKTEGAKLEQNADRPPALASVLSSTRSSTRSPVPSAAMGPVLSPRPTPGPTEQGNQKTEGAKLEQNADRPPALASVLSSTRSSMRSPVPSAAMGPVLSASQYAKMPGVIGHGGVAHAGHLHPSLPTSQHVAAVGKKPGPPWRLPSAAPLKAQAKNTKTRMPSKIWCDQQLALHGKHTGRSTPVTALDSFACLHIDTCMRVSFIHGWHEICFVGTS